MNDEQSAIGNPRPVMVVEPVVLAGAWVRLEPPTEAHTEALFAVGQSPEVWDYLGRGPFTTMADARRWVQGAIKEADDGSQLPFAIVHLATGRAVGSTRYMDIVRND